MISNIITTIMNDFEYYYNNYEWFQILLQQLWMISNIITIIMNDFEYYYNNYEWFQILLQ